MARTISTSLIRQLERQTIDATPFARASDEIQLVNIVSNSAHLGPMITNAHSACFATSLAAAGVFGGFELVAPASRTLTVYFLSNTASGNLRCMLAPVGTFTPAAAAPCMEWGDEPVLATINNGTRNVTLTGEIFQFAPGAVGITPIYVAPGETLAVQHGSANTVFTASIAWEEVG